MNKKNKFMYQLLVFVVFIVLPSANGYAQQVLTADSNMKPPQAQIPEIFFDPVTYLWALLIIMIFASFLVLTRAIHALSKELEGRIHGASEAQGRKTEYVKQVSAWSKLMHRMTRSVSIEHEADVMLDHDYDGIRELDNQLPPWWKWGFVLTIIFAFIYLLNYHVSGSGKLQAAEYADEITAANLAKETRLKNNLNNVTAATVTRLSDEVSIAAGKTTFMTLCAACHGQQAQGMVGPNLTDEFWIHGGGIANLFNTITEGVPDKGMISWKNQLAPKQIQAVASYILSLQGSNPAGAKEPQGAKWIESAVPADSSAVDSAATKKI